MDDSQADRAFKSKPASGAKVLDQKGDADLEQRHPQDADIESALRQEARRSPRRPIPGISWRLSRLAER